MLRRLLRHATRNLLVILLQYAIILILTALPPSASKNSPLPSLPPSPSTIIAHTVQSECWIVVRRDISDRNAPNTDEIPVSNQRSPPANLFKLLPRSAKQFYSLSPDGPVVLFSGFHGGISGATAELEEWMREGKRRASTIMNEFGDEGSDEDASTSKDWQIVEPPPSSFIPTAERVAAFLTSMTHSRCKGDNLHCLVVGSDGNSGFDIMDVSPNGLVRNWSKGGSTSIGRLGAGIRRVLSTRKFLDPKTSIPSFDDLLEALCHTYGEVEEWEGGERDPWNLIGSLRVMKMCEGGKHEYVDDEEVEAMIEDYIKRRGEKMSGLSQATT